MLTGKKAVLFFTCTLLLFTLTSGLSAQQKLTPVTFPLPYKDVSLAGNAEYAIVYGDGRDIKIISSLPFIPLNNIAKEHYLRLPDSAGSIFIRFHVRNELPLDTAIVLKIYPSYDPVILYQTGKWGLQEIGRSERDIPVSELSKKNDFKRIKVPLKAGQTQTFIVEEQRSLQSQPGIPVLQSEDQASLEELLFEKKNVLPRWKIFLVFAGFHLAIFFYSIIKYFIQNNDRAYLYYSLFTFFISVIYLLETGTINLESVYWNNLRNYREISFIFNVTSALCYIAFQNELLQLKTTKPRLFKWIKVYAGIVLFGLVLSVIFNQIRFLPVIEEFSLFLFQVGQILGSGTIAYIIRKRQGFYRYIFYGLISLLTGFCIFVLIFWSGLHHSFPSWFGIDTHVILPAIALEMLFFLMALVYRDKQVELAKVTAQQQLVEQLEQNKILQNSFTTNLEQQVRIKTEQLIEQRTMLEKESEAKLLADFKRKFSESELKALRSQINPHFIFNVLNTIESYALQNKPELVSDMIQKFSKLTRLVLENSMHQVVPVVQDWEALRLYIELEQMRYKEPFTVIYDMEENLLEPDYRIPPMLIQPYVENAILHGLRNLHSKDGILTIRGSLDGHYIIISIEDNGIGRQLSSLYKVPGSLQKNSLGMKVTQDRIAIFNNLAKGRKATVLIEDCKTGTRVTLHFPIH